jgi:2-polyprenyl-6-methoxyphenol hydroxylase-like FAD-dependent oxidoreductase
MKHTEVLIVGAGPTGLALALWLTRLGVDLRIIDKTAGPGTTSRALAVHARTLELYRQLDLADVVVNNGHKVSAVNLWVKGEPQTRVLFEAVGEDLTPYPFMHIFPQDEHERLLIDKLQSLGVTVERETELVHYSEEGDRVIARLQKIAGEETCDATYVAGCDGARSIVRQTMGTGFPGGTYQQVFYVADVEAAGPPMNGELNIDMDEADFLAVFPLKEPGHARLVGTIRDERAQHPEELKFEDVRGRAIEHLKVDVKKVNWFSTYRVHHRVTDHFRKGRAFLLGDAAHIHSPAGGQGMNTGIGDAINLAWKLAEVLERGAPESILDSYEPERIAFARKLVKTTDKVFTLASAEGTIADIIRTRIVPLVLPTVARVSAWREWLFRTVSQLTINYRDSPLSEGAAGEIHGGDRMPWVKSLDNFQSLVRMAWQVHVYGVASPDLTAWCKSNDLALNVYAWRDECASAGLAQNALYLLRPDTYVALAETSGSPVKVLDKYFKDRGLTAGNTLIQRNA